MNRSPRWSDVRSLPPARPAWLRGRSRRTRSFPGWSRAWRHLHAPVKFVLHRVPCRRTSRVSTWAHDNGTGLRRQCGPTRTTDLEAPGRGRRAVAYDWPRGNATRGCSSAGRATALQAVGRGFESLHLHREADVSGAPRRRPETVRSPDCWGPEPRCRADGRSRTRSSDCRCPGRWTAATNPPAAPDSADCPG